MENEVTEMWREIRKERREKKRNNRKSSTDILLENGIKFESKNNGVHLVIDTSNRRTRGKIIDFWPSTGKWIVRNGKKGRGIRRLLELMENEDE